MRNQRRQMIALLFLVSICLLAGCTRRNTTSGDTPQESTTQEKKQETGNTVTGVISNIDTELSQISISDVGNGWIYKIAYNGTTTLKSRYEEPIAVEQLEIGEIVDVVYDSDNMLASSIQISYDAWEYEEVTGLTYNQKENHIWIMGEEYTYNASLVLYDKTQEEAETQEQTTETTQEQTTETTQEDSTEVASADGTEAQGHISLSEISDQDTVTCRGYKGKICSVVVISGHGYVRLSDYSTYIGGMIAIGNVIQPVTENMVLTVPVGNWTLEIDKDGRMGTKDIVVSQNEEQTVNLASLTIIACRRGVMHFVTNPDNCVITIDGVDYEGRTDFILGYGKHKVVVGAVGYKSYNGTINLNSAYINVNVELTPLSEETDSSAETSSTTQQSKSFRSGSTTEQAVQTTEAAASTTEQTVTTEAN